LLRYLLFPWRNFSDQWHHSLLALLSVTVGVATVVVMLNLAEVIQRNTTGDAHLRLHADLVVDLDGIKDELLFFEQLQAEGILAAYTAVLQRQAQIRYGDASSLVTVIGVEPGVYPLYGQIPLLDGQGKQTAVDGAALLQESGAAIITSNAADRLGLQIGDEVLLVNDGSTTVRVQGIALSTGPVPLSFDASTIFGYIFIDQADAAAVLSEPSGSANRVFLRLASSDDLERVSARISEHAPAWRVLTSAQVARQTGDRLEIITQLLRYVGLLSLLIGGVGVAHTVRANFSRRRLQIATLKALGFRSRQIFLQLSIESLLIGVLGSIAGIGLGLLVGWGSVRVVEGFIFQALAFHVSWFAVISGFVVGTLTVFIFAIWPILSASQVRPADLLRQVESSRARPGLLWLALLPLLLAVALLSGIILTNLVHGFIFATGLFVVSAALIILLSWFLWLISRFPSFRSPVLAFVLANVGRERRRAATAVLAFTIGIFAVGTITVLAENARSGIRQVWQQAVAYDVVAFASADHDPMAIAASLEQWDNVTEVALARLSRATLVAVDTMPADVFLETHQDQIREAGIRNMLSSVDGRDLESGLPDKQVASGRMLVPADTGRPVAMISSLIAQTLPLGPGSTLTFGAADGSDPVTWEIVGIYRELGWSVGGTGILTSMETVAAFDAKADAILRIKAAPGQEETVHQDMGRRYPTLFILSSQELLYSFTALLDSLAIFPTLVAFLSLFAGVVIVANNSILALLERRHEVGILKAVGIRHGRVLALLMLENGFLGFIGSALGMFLALLASYLLTTQGMLGDSVEPVFSGMVIMAVLAGGLLVVLLTTVVTSWTTIRTRPLLILRKE
jgi:putative ABC transport system permease protein